MMKYSAILAVSLVASVTAGGAASARMLSCSGYICKVSVFNPLGGGEPPVAYTLRRYQP